jgi:hypothetical protein
MHICPQELAAVAAVLPFIGVLWARLRARWRARG